jgi:hypothetical protein
MLSFALTTAGALFQTWTYHFQAVSFSFALWVFLPKNVIVRPVVVLFVPNTRESARWDGNIHVTIRIAPLVHADAHGISMNRPKEQGSETKTTTKLITN